MPWLDVIWDAETEAHVAEHGLTPGDVEAALRDPIGRDVSESSGNPIVFGRARDGRKILVAYEQVDAITVLVVTAYEVP